MKLPNFLKKYFWDVDFLELKKENHSRFIIERILEFGDQKAVKWMMKNFGLEEIKKVLRQSRNLSTKSANFWRFIFNVRRDRILCLKESFQKKQRITWLG